MFANQQKETHTIRYPATANLMIDSADRETNVYSSPWDFQITKSNALINGFFSRVGTTEVVLEWCADNISDDFENREIVVDISGGGGNTTNLTDQSVTIPNGVYTAAGVIDALVDSLTDLSGVTGGMIWEALPIPGGLIIQTIGGQVGYINIPYDTKLSNQLDISTGEQLELFAEIFCPDLRPYRYLDFTSQQLTYAQDVKDSSTAKQVRDVLCRWYFCDDTPNQLDKYGFPILMGYTRFCQRRIFNPPKQIKWDNNLPVGNLKFEVYGNDGEITKTGLLESNFLMTLQLSEN